jgi:prolipoprotein diacylglyceryl transferase
MPLLAQIPPPPSPSLPIPGLDVRYYGVLIAIGAYLALRLAATRYERMDGDPEQAERAALVALIAGLVGARIGYLIPRFLVDGPHGSAYIGRPLDALAIWEGGLTIFGGLFFGALAAFLYVRRKQMPFDRFADAVAPGLPLAQAIGRWGNYFNQELYGRPLSSDIPWALEIRREGQAPQYVHPTFLYESLWNLTLVVVLLWVDRRGRLKRGSLMFCYLIGYGIGRTWIEALRVDTVERYLGLSRNNWIAILIIVVGIAGLIWWQRRAPVADDPGLDALGEVVDPAAGTAATEADPAAPHVDLVDDPGGDVEEVDGSDGDREEIVGSDGDEEPEVSDAHVTRDGSDADVTRDGSDADGPVDDGDDDPDPVADAGTTYTTGAGETARPTEAGEITRPAGAHETARPAEAGEDD